MTMSNEQINEAVSPSRWHLTRPDYDYRHDPSLPSIELMKSPFYQGDRYAVRNSMGRCLNINSEWEYEPSPSSRDDAFYERCRFKSFGDAVAAALAAVGQGVGDA